jgi:hypothetical protein
MKLERRCCCYTRTCTVWSEVLKFVKEAPGKRCLKHYLRRDLYSMSEQGMSQSTFGETKLQNVYLSFYRVLIIAACERVYYIHTHKYLNLFLLLLFCL